MCQVRHWQTSERGPEVQAGQVLQQGVLPGGQGRPLSQEAHLAALYAELQQLKKPFYRGCDFVGCCLPPCRRSANGVLDDDLEGTTCWSDTSCSGRAHRPLWLVNGT